MSKKKIVYVSSARIPTGRAHGLQIMYMCAEFTKAGYEVELVVPKKKNTVGEDPFRYYRIEPTFTIRTIPIPDLGSRTSGIPLLAFLIDECVFMFQLLLRRIARPGDILYTRDYPVLFAFSPRRNKLCLEVHDIPQWRILFGWALKRVHTVIAISRGVRDAIERFGISRSRIAVAHDAVYLEDFSQPESQHAARERLHLPLDKKIALYIGRIDDWKGTETFFESAAFLPGDTCAAVIGGEVKQIEKLSQRYPAVLFLGSRPYHELADNQSAADVLVLPNSGRFDISARYTSPLKLFSYMTSGKPIVASDLPSIREIIDERSAYMVTPDNPESLATGIREALTDKGVSTRAARAKEIVRSYTWEARTRAILATINRI